MSGTTRDARSVAGALSRVLVAGSRDDFELLLTEDVHWHGEDDAECHGRATAGQFFAEIAARGALAVDDVDLRGANGGSDSDDASDTSVAQVRLAVTMVPHDRNARPHRHRLDLTISEGLISRIVQAAAPPRIEVLHVDDCPNHEELLPRLRALLADHAIDADLVTTLVDSDDAADWLLFLGSPTVRVNGRDVDPTAADRTGYGMQCRLYRAPDGTVTGAPSDAMVLDALVDTSPAGTRRPGHPRRRPDHPAASPRQRLGPRPWPAGRPRRPQSAARRHRLAGTLPERRRHDRAAHRCRR